MKILISGASGFVGSDLARCLRAEGHAVTALSRSGSQSGGDPTITWDPRAGLLDAEALSGFDVVVHLAGENIASGRWTPASKKAIRESRVAGTRLLVEKLAASSRPPRLLVSASAIGYYGNRGDEELTEASSKGEGFLPDVCAEWEDAAMAAPGLRVVCLRFGMILSPDGGALARMLTPFRLGLGGHLGSGRQFVSWITLHDAVRVIKRAIRDENLSGALNVVAPGAVANTEFAETLARALHRPAAFPVPVFALHFLFGEMADELLLSSQRVVPERLLRNGFSFDYPELESAFTRLLASHD